MDLITNLNANAWPALMAIIALATTIASSATITAIMTQLAKLPIVPIYASKYPRVTAVIFAILTASIATAMGGAVIVVDLASFLFYIAITAVVSFKIYDVTKPIVDELRQPKV